MFGHLLHLDSPHSCMLLLKMFLEFEKKKEKAAPAVAQNCLDTNSNIASCENRYYLPNNMYPAIFEYHKK